MKWHSDKPHKSSALQSVTCGNPRYLSLRLKTINWCWTQNENMLFPIQVSGVCWHTNPYYWHYPTCQCPFLSFTTGNPQNWSLNHPAPPPPSPPPLCPPPHLHLYPGLGATHPGRWMVFVGGEWIPVFWSISCEGQPKVPPVEGWVYRVRLCLHPGFTKTNP